MFVILFFVRAALRWIRFTAGCLGNEFSPAYACCLPKNSGRAADGAFPFSKRAKAVGSRSKGGMNSTRLSALASSWDPPQGLAALPALAAERAVPLEAATRNRSSPPWIPNLALWKAKCSARPRNGSAGPVPGDLPAGFFEPPGKGGGGFAGRTSGRGAVAGTESGRWDTGPWGWGGVVLAAGRGSLAIGPPAARFLAGCEAGGGGEPGAFWEDSAALAGWLEPSRWQWKNEWAER